MKPIIILPPATMAEDQIQALRDNGLCVVVATDPSLVKFVDPIPAMEGRTQVDQAAIQLSRKILAKGFWGTDAGRHTVAAAFVDILVKGTALDPSPSQEQEEDYFRRTKMLEIERIAREEARAERAAKKAAQAKENRK